jgi:PST family polysaccharide transporter
MTQPSSYRAILRSSSIIGGSSVLNIAVGLVKMKVAAMLLGPAGVGLIGLYQNLMQTASTVGALGFGTVGARQVATAESQGDPAAVDRARRALFWGSLALALLSGLLFWCASGWIAAHVLGARQRSGDVAWLAVGVSLMIAAGSQSALLIGLRRIGDVARIQVVSGILGAALGAAAIVLWGPRGLLAMVLVAPIATFLAGHWFVARIDRPTGAPTPLSKLASEWRVMVGLGAAFMLSALVTMLGQLAVRTLVQRELGLDALGQFQAAWAIGMTYLGFVLGAMGTDYYPRLSAAIGDPEVATRIVNEQIEVATLLCGPVVLGVLALTPWLVHLLYSARFAATAEILRWQLLGDILKVASWPLGFVLLAAGAGRAYIFTETSAMVVFCGGSALLTPRVGVAATGIAFLAMYVWYLPLVYLLARRRLSFRWRGEVIRQIVALILAAILVELAARGSDALSAAVGAPLAALFGLYGFARLGRMAELQGKIGRLADLSRRMVVWTGVRL